MKAHLLTLLLLLLGKLSHGQTPPSIQWQQTYGGSDADVGRMLALTHDGGYVMVGTSTSVSEHVEANAGSSDIWIVRMDAEGEMIWNRTFGGSGEDDAVAVRLTPNDEIIILANTNSEDGPFGDPISDNDMVLGHLAPNGDLVSFKRLGHDLGNAGSDVLVLENGDRIVLGSAIVQAQDLTLHIDVLLSRISESGTLIWESFFGGTGNESSFGIDRYANGDLMIVATTRSDDGDVTNYMGMGDGWLLRVDLDGELIEQRTLGGPYDDQITRALPTADGGVIITGYFSYFLNEWPRTRVVAVKLDAAGNTEWTRDYGGLDGDYGWYVQQVADGGYLLFAHAYSADGDVTDFQGTIDAWLLRLNSSGDILWDRCFGWWEQEAPGDIKVTPDGGVILLVTATTPIPEMTTYLGSLDTWVIKLGPEIVGIPEPAEAPFSLLADGDGRGATIHALSSGGLIEVTNATGQLMQRHQMKATTLHIDLEACTPGVYFLTLINGHEKYTLPLAK